MTDIFVPKRAFFTKGMGRGRYMLEAFDCALRDAGVASQNLVAVSSVFPPDCEIISKEEGVKALSAGRVTFAVMARMESNDPETSIGASVALVLPRGRKPYGDIAEYHGTVTDETTAAHEAAHIASALLSSKTGIPIAELDIERTEVAAQAATVSEKGEWVSVVALCVFLLDV